MATEKRARVLFTVKEVASYLQVNQTTIYRLLRESQIPAFKVGGNWRFDVEHIDAWLRRDSASIERTSRDARLEPSSPPDAMRPEVTTILSRICDELHQMLGPIAEISRMVPIINRIADTLADKRDPSREIAALYDGKVALRTHAEDLLKFVPSAFGVTDTKRNLVSFNDAYAHLFGFRHRHLRSVPVTDLVHPDDLTRFTTFGAKMWKGTTESASVVVRRLTGRGDAITVKSRAWPIRCAPGGPAQYLAAVLEKVATSKEASAQIARCAEGLSRRREKIFAR